MTKSGKFVLHLRYRTSKPTCWFMKRLSTKDSVTLGNKSNSASAKKWRSLKSKKVDIATLASTGSTTSTACRDPARCTVMTNTATAPMSVHSKASVLISLLKWAQNWGKNWWRSMEASCWIQSQTSSNAKYVKSWAKESNLKKNWSWSIKTLTSPLTVQWLIASGLKTERRL